MWSQSTVLPFLAILALCAAQGDYQGSDGGPNRKLSFPNMFYFGAGSSSYQIEGSWNKAGKSPSIWDDFVHMPGNIKDNSTGDDACKSYEYYKRDIEMLKYLGVDYYRFSIPWSRILPTGFPDKINQEAIDHYNDLINELLKYDIRPFVTMYHWDLPARIQDDFGGWTNPAIVLWFRDYAEVLFENFGDRVPIWSTFNEPSQIINGYNSKMFAPGKESTAGIGDYLAAKNIIMAHAQAYHLYYEKYHQDQNGILSITLATDYYQGLSNSADDAQASRDSYDFRVGMFANPIFSLNGGFPPRVVELVAAKSKEQGYFRSRLPEFTDEERKFCQGTADFYSMNHYTTHYVTRTGYKPNTNRLPSLTDDLGVVTSFKNYPLTESEHVAVIPHGIRGALKYIKEAYGDANGIDPPVIVSENGAAQAAVNDTQKIDYLTKYIANVLGAMIEDNVVIYGYSAWSLMDDFEWSDGYQPKFGLFKVDFDDPERKRTTRLSAIWYRELLTNKTLDPEYEPKYEQIEF